MSIGGIDSMNFQAQALQLQAERGRVLASNIANADTPNYKARDFNFQQALAAATSGTGAGAGAGAGAGGTVPIALTQPGHMALPSSAGGLPALMYRAPLQNSVDGNTVDLDVERANFAENSVRYESTLRFINGQIKMMTTAINGQ